MKILHGDCLEQDDDVWEFQRRAGRYALSQWKDREQAKDFASWATIKFLEGRHAAIWQLYIDFLRETNADSRTKGYEEKRALKRVMQFEASENQVQTIHQSEMLGLFEILRNSDRAITVLFFQWGLNENEIAHCFGVTESRISQRLTGIKERLSKRIAKEEPEGGRTSAGRMAEICFGEGLEMAGGSLESLAFEESGFLEGIDEAGLDEWTA